MSDFGDIDDGQYTAVIDSIEDGFVTVFIEADGTDIGNAVLDITELPTEGRHADAILNVQITDGEAIEWTYDPEQTTTRKEKSQNRFDRLSERPPSDEDSS